MFRTPSGKVHPFEFYRGIVYSQNPLWKKPQKGLRGCREYTYQVQTHSLHPDTK